MCFTNIIGVNASDYPLKSSDENDGYVVVSNESVSTSGQYTGYFNIDNSKYSLNKNLELHDYKIDVNLPFAADKNKDKLLPKKNIYGKAIIPSYKVGG